MFNFGSHKSCLYTGSEGNGISETKNKTHTLRSKGKFKSYKISNIQTIISFQCQTRKSGSKKEKMRPKKKKTFRKQQN